MASTPLKPEQLQALFASDSPAIRKEPSQTKNITNADIAAAIAHKVPGRSLEEVTEMVRTINGCIMDVLLEGTVIKGPDGTTWHLDEDGRTVIVTMPGDDPRLRSR